jgi:hypothetical protein
VGTASGAASAGGEAKDEVTGDAEAEAGDVVEVSSSLDAFGDAAGGAEECGITGGAVASGAEGDHDERGRAAATGAGAIVMVDTAAADSAGAGEDEAVAAAGDAMVGSAMMGDGMAVDDAAGGVAAAHRDVLRAVRAVRAAPIQEASSRTGGLLASDTAAAALSGCGTKWRRVPREPAVRRRAGLKVADEGDERAGRRRANSSRTALRARLAAAASSIASSESRIARETAAPSCRGRAGV